MVKFCQNCGKQNKESDKFCQNCGTELTEEISKNQKPTDTSTGLKNEWDKQSGIKKAAILCCIGLIVLVVIAEITPNKTSNYTKSNTTQPVTTTQTSTQSNLPEYTVANSKFQLQKEWKQVNDVKGENMSKFFNGNDLSIIVQQFSDEQSFISDYNEISTSSSNYPVKTSTKTIAGTNVKVATTTSTTSSIITESYYFQKNNKYYGIFFEDNRNSKIKSTIDDALNSVITTIK